MSRIDELKRELDDADLNLVKEYANEFVTLYKNLPGSNEKQKAKNKMEALLNELSDSDNKSKETGYVFYPDKAMKVRRDVYPNRSKLARKLHEDNPGISEAKFMSTISRHEKGDERKITTPTSEAAKIHYQWLADNGYIATDLKRLLRGEPYSSH